MYKYSIYKVNTIERPNVWCVDYWGYVGGMPVDLLGTWDFGSHEHALAFVLEMLKVNH